MKVDVLVDGATLEKHLGDPTWVVFDTRHDLAQPGKGRDAYSQGHIPGAYFLHLDDDLSGPKNGRNGRHPLPDPNALAARLARCGLRAGSQAVIYDDTGGSYAVRLWWMLRWLGHERAALLDGGFPAWVKEHRPISQATPPDRDAHARDDRHPREGGGPISTEFIARPDATLAVDAALVERIREDAARPLIDARSAERFAGRNETIDPVAGHVPGAINRFWQANVGADGRFKSPAALRAEFESLLAGTDPAAVVHMCGSGVTACHNAFAMTLAGLPAGRLYPGSWSEWCADPARAVARG